MKSYIVLILISFTIVLNGCGSAPKKQKTDESEDSAAAEPVIAAYDEPKTVAAEAPRENVPKKITTGGPEVLLMNAIKRQSEIDMTSAANDLLMGNPAHLKALNALGLIQYKKGKYKAAEFFLNKALVTNAHESGLYNNLALVKLAQGEQREAIKFFKLGLEQKLDDVAISTNLGAIYAAQKDYSNAEIALEVSHKNGTKDIKVLSNYAVALAANKKFAEASKIYEKLMSENGSSREIMLNYAIHLIDNVKSFKQGSDILNRLRFVGAPPDARNTIIALENKAKAGLK